MSMMSLFFLFLRMGAFTFGGGIVMIGFLEKELRDTGRLSTAEITDMIVYATAFPGPIAVNVSWLAGKRLAGRRGAVIAVLGTSLPPFLVILLLSHFLLASIDTPSVSAFFLGASCAVAVIIGQVVYGMAKITVMDGWKDFSAFLLVVVLLMGLKLSPFAALGGGLALRLALGVKGK